MLTKVRIILLLLLFNSAARAQMNNQFETEQNEVEEQIVTPRRKTPSFFHSPEQATPEAQLSYARKLEAEGRTRKASGAYLDLVHEWHVSPQAAAAQLAYASLLETRGNYQKAFDEYQYLIDYFPGRFPYMDVVQRQFAIASHLMSEGERSLFRSPLDAIPYFEAVVSNAPNWERAAEAKFQVGLILEADEQYDQAVIAYETVQYRFPRSELAASAAYRRAYSLYKLANRHHRDESALREALSALSIYLRDFEADPNVNQAEQYLDELKSRLAAMHYRQASFYDEIVNRPESAIIAYRDFLREFPSSEQAVQVSKRLEELRGEVQSDEAR